jgi:hypothetical protein
MLLPKALRWRVYSMVWSIRRSRLRSAAGRAPQPLFLELQHLEGEAQAFLADQVALGTRTLSKNSCAVSELCMPILWIFCR